MNLTPIRFSVNTHGCDKKWDYEKLATGYQDKTGTLQNFADHIKQGHAVCAGLLGGQRRTKANVIGSQVSMLDVDNSAPLLGDDGKPVKGEDGKSIKVYDPQLTLDQALAHPFIKQYCALIYTSASHKPDWHKFRLVFLLPQYETDTGIIEAMIRQLMEQLPHDPACKDASRVFYGNTRAEIPLFNPNVTLPTEWREQAIFSAAEESSKKEQQRQARVVKQVGYQRQIERGEVNPEDTDKLILDALRSIPPRDPGTGNYEECLTVLMALYDHFGEGEAERVAERWSPSIKGTTWDIGRKLRTFKRGGVGIGSLFHIAKQHGWKFPERERTEWPKSEPTISPEEWQYKFGLPSWFKAQLAKLPKIFKGFGKPPKTIDPKPLPQTIKYIPGELPSTEEYKALGCPTVRFAPGQRLQLLAELVELGYHDILDSSSTGTSKSHDAGLASPSRFGVDRLWYLSEDHRNPTTPTGEANYSDMPVRNNGMVVDDTRRTALNNPHIRWPRFDEKATTEGNCWRTHLYHTLAAKGYQAEVGSEAKENLICGTCYMANNCASKGDATPLPGASFRSERRDAFLNSRIRASINSAPNPKDLLALVGTSVDGGAEETETNRNGAFLDEAMRQLKPTDAIEIFLTDFDQMFGEIESKLPDIHEVLKPLRLALRPILAGEVAPTKETYHGLNDAAVRSTLAEFKEKLFGTDDQSGNLIIPEIIAQLKSILPNLEEILKEPDGFNKDGVAAKDRKGVSKETSKFIRSRVRQESYRDIAKELRSLPSNWLIPFLEVWNGSQRGALRINNGVLTVTTRNTRHAEICKAMQWVCYLDATANREYLALHLDIDPSNIVQIAQEPARVENLTIVEVTGLGLCGHGRSDDLIKRIDEALKPAFKIRHPDIGFLEHKAYAQVSQGDGWWFFHNRGSNEYKTRSAIASFGTPYQNIGALQDLWLTLTGDRNVDKDAPGFSKFVKSQTQSEVTQAVGRLRANLRPDEQLTHYSCADFDLSFLADYYPGATIKQEAAVNITPQAGTTGQRTRWRLMQGIRSCVATGEKLTLSALANHAHITKGRASQIVSEMGGWRNFKKCLAALIESLYTEAKLFEPLAEELIFIATGYFPLVAEEAPPDVAFALINTAQAYGWEAFRAVLAVTSPETRGKFLGALLSGFPPGLIEELRAIAAEFGSPVTVT